MGREDVLAGLFTLFRCPVGGLRRDNVVLDAKFVEAVLETARALLYHGIASCALNDGNFGNAVLGQEGGRVSACYFTCFDLVGGNQGSEFFIRNINSPFARIANHYGNGGDRNPLLSNFVDERLCNDRIQWQKANRVDVLSQQIINGIALFFHAAARVDDYGFHTCSFRRIFEAFDGGDVKWVTDGCRYVPERQFGRIGCGGSEKEGEGDGTVKQRSVSDLLKLGNDKHHFMDP
ncbi:hypothetical protein D3C81_205390 [compost metagenome]